MQHLPAPKVATRSESETSVSCRSVSDQLLCSTGVSAATSTGAAAATAWRKVKGFFPVELGGFGEAVAELTACLSCRTSLRGLLMLARTRTAAPRRARVSRSRGLEVAEMSVTRQSAALIEMRDPAIPAPRKKPA